MSVTTRKRSRDASSRVDEDFAEQPCKRSKLTTAALKTLQDRLFSTLDHQQNHYTDMADLLLSRRQSAKSLRSQTEGTAISDQSKRIKPDNSRYAGALARANIRTAELDPDKRPANFDDIKRRLERNIADATPVAEADFEDFKKEVYKVCSESKALTDFFSREPFVPNADRKRFETEQDVEFSQWDAINDDEVALAKPDIYDGIPSDLLYPLIRRQLRHVIIPAIRDTLPDAPNFFVECKGSTGRADVVMLQACYDAALGARAQHYLQNYGSDTVTYDHVARSFAATYLDGHLKLYCTHITAPVPENPFPSYHMSQLRAFALTDCRERYEEGVTAFRNMRMLACEYREEVKEKVNGKVSIPAEGSGITLVGSLDDHVAAYTARSGNDTARKLGTSPVANGESQSEMQGAASSEFGADDATHLPTMVAQDTTLQRVPDLIVPEQPRRSTRQRKPARHD